MTSERITIYRVVLTDYLKRSEGVLNLANITEPLGRGGNACLCGLDAEPSKETALIVHRITPALIANQKIVLIDPNHQQATIQRNDPQSLIESAIVTGQKIDDVSYNFFCGRLCGHGRFL